MIVFKIALFITVTGFYLFLALWIKNPQQGSAERGKINLGGLSMIADRIRLMPFIHFCFPGSPKQLTQWVSALTLIGLIPIFVTAWLCFCPVTPQNLSDTPSIVAANESYTSLAHLANLRLSDKQLDSKDSLNFCFGLIALCIAWGFTRCLSCALCLLEVPKECGRSGWALQEWLDITKQMPTETTFSLRNFSSNTKRNLYFYLCLSYAVQLAGLLSLFPIIYFVGNDSNLYIALYLGAVGFSFFIAICIRKHISKEVIAGCKPDTVRKPILYLRAFKDDSDLAEQASHFDPTSVEERIIAALAAGGQRIVALGKPGEQSTPLGAERYYVNDDIWQETITNWVHDSHAIVMLASTTEATAWEIEEIFQTNAQDRFLLLFAQRNFSASGRLRSNSTATDVEQVSFARLESLGVNLSNIPTLKQDENLLGIAFDSEKNPTLLTAQIASTSALEEALKWHLNHLGVTANQPGNYVPQKINNLISASFAVAGVSLLTAFVGAFYMNQALISRDVNSANFEPQKICSGQAIVNVPPEWNCVQESLHSTLFRAAWRGHGLYAVRFKILPKNQFANLDAESAIQMEIQQRNQDMAILKATATKRLGSETWLIKEFSTTLNGCQREETIACTKLTKGVLLIDMLLDCNSLGDFYGQSFIRLMESFQFTNTQTVRLLDQELVLPDAWLVSDQEHSRNFQRAQITIPGKVLSSIYATRQLYDKENSRVEICKKWDLKNDSRKSLPNFNMEIPILSIFGDNCVWKGYQFEENGNITEHLLGVDNKGAWHILFSHDSRDSDLARKVHELFGILVETELGDAPNNLH